jgi:hypothetical protein
MLDRCIGMEAGTGEQIVKAGDTMTLIDPRTGQREQKIVAGRSSSTAGSSASTAPWAR